MGYDIYGTVKVTFADADHLAGYLNTERPTTPLRTSSDGKALVSEFKDFCRGYFEGHGDFTFTMLRSVDPSDPTVRFDIRISGRSTSADDFLDTSIAQWASQVDGSFVGEDDTGWAWKLTDGVIREMNCPRLEGDEYEELTAAKTRLDRMSQHADALAAALTAGDTTEAAAHAALLALADHPTPALLTALADHPDRRVQDTVTSIVTAAAQT